MMKSITLFICLLFITTAGISQEFNMLDTSPGEKSQFQEREWELLDLQDDEMNWREKSVGLFFMPVPLKLDVLNINLVDGTTFDDSYPSFFTVGFGASFNYDFKKSGDGLGLIAYVAYIIGTGAEVDELTGESIGLDGAFDIFTALKYDIKLGALSKFELSPLAGLGLLSVSGEGYDGPISGTSLYFSGGVRITYLVMNNLFVGADIQSVPLVFDAQGLFSIPDSIPTAIVVDDMGDPILDDSGDFTFINTDVDSVKIKYELPIQVNLSIRYNIF
jgi:hypothetical protein